MAIVYGTNGSQTINAADGVTSGADASDSYGGSDLIFGGRGEAAMNGGGGIDAALTRSSLPITHVNPGTTLTQRDFFVL